MLYNVNKLLNIGGYYEKISKSITFNRNIKRCIYWLWHKQSKEVSDNENSSNISNEEKNNKEEVKNDNNDKKESKGSENDTKAKRRKIFRK